MLLLMLVGIGASGQETETITYYDNFVDYGNIAGYLAPLSDKEERVSSNAGKIIYESDTQLPDSVRICIEAAKDIWESRLGNGALVRLKFVYGNTISGNDVEIDVSYNRGSSILRPISLYRYLNNIEENDSTSADATITINSAIPWNCSHKATSVNGSRNLTYSLLRSIAVTLGVGSSVTQKRMTSGKDIIAFATLRGTHTIFDTLIFDDEGARLSDIPNVGNRNNVALNTFIQPSTRTIYALKADDEHRMYAPQVYEPFRSLIYMDNPNSLMYYDAAVGDKVLQIDTTTIELLNAIGWDMPTKDVEIIGEGIPNTGIASAYEPHTFTVRNHTGQQLSDIRWKFVLPLKDGKDDVIEQRDNTLDFSIPKISNVNKYNVNINGDIYGIIEFSAYANGMEVRDAYRVSLELKPEIRSVNIISKTSHLAPYESSYDLDCVVEYVGCNQLLVQLEEEYSSILESQIVNEPFLAHINVETINGSYYAWLDITAQNKYGKDVYTIELPPYPDDSNHLVSNRVRKTVISGVTVDTERIEVFNLIGNKIVNLSDLSEIEKLPCGIYILNKYHSGILVNQSKYIKK